MFFARTNRLTGSKVHEWLWTPEVAELRLSGQRSSRKEKPKEFTCCCVVTFDVVEKGKMFFTNKKKKKRFKMRTFYKKFLAKKQFL